MREGNDMERSALYDKDIEDVWNNNPIANSTRRAAFFAGATEDTMLRAVILQLHKEHERIMGELLKLNIKAQTFDLMTEGITTSDGKRFVFRMPQ